MAQEWLYMNKVNGWDKMDVAVTANATQVPKIEINISDLRDLSQRARVLFAQQAALAAQKQEVTKELQEVIQDGEAMMKFLREGLKAHYGKDSEKLIEFGLQPFRGLKPSAPKGPTPEAPKSSDPVSGS